jgi:hypothetical protein
VDEAKDGKIGRKEGKMERRKVQVTNGGNSGWDVMVVVVVV